MTIDIAYARQVATGAAYKAGEMLRGYFRDPLVIDKKGDKDLVTEADRAAEETIIETIRYRFPDHDIMAEESGRLDNHSGFCWIIDPLDGTTNFTHGIAIFSVSIALSIDGEIVAGVVLNPATGELFAADSESAAVVNGEPVSVSGTPVIEDALLVTGFPYDYKKHLKKLMTRFSRCLEAAGGVRRLGSAALDLCYLACGRFDGYWEENLHPWDTAAGMLIARQAGALVTDFSGEAFSPEKKELLATNGILHQKIKNLLKIEEVDQ